MNVAAARRWAYAGIVLGGAASITMNVTSTVYQDSNVSLFLRVPGAIFWPVAVYVAVEILTRTLWSRVWTHVLARLVLILPVAGVAAVVSYLHGQHVLKLFGEIPIVQNGGPVAIDGLLFGAAFVLLITAGDKTEDTERVSLAARVAAMRTSAVDTIAAARGQDMGKPPPAAVHVPSMSGVPDKSMDMSLDKDAAVVLSGVLDMSLDKDAAVVLSGVLDMSRDKDMDMTEDIGDVVQSVSRDKPVSRTRGTWDKDETWRLFADTLMSNDEIARAVSTDKDKPVSAKTIQRERAKYRAAHGLPA